MPMEGRPARLSGGLARSGPCPLHQQLKSGRIYLLDTSKAELPQDQAERSITLFLCPAVTDGIKASKLSRIDQ